MNRDTVSGYFVQAAVARLAPAARARVLAEAGIGPELLATPAARVPAAAFSALWLAVARELDDEFFGLDRRRMKVGSFALLCQAAQPAPDLGRALVRVLRGLRAALDDIEGRLAVDSGSARLVLDNRIADPAARRFADETFLVLVHGVLCWLAGRRIPLTAAAFAHPRPAHAAEYPRMFGEALAFDAPATAIAFDAAWLAAPVRPGAAAVAAFLRAAPGSVFMKARNPEAWTARLRRHLRDGLATPEGPRLADTARALHLSPTTLRRRLEAEGTGWQALKDELRRDTAIHLLSQGALPVAEVARRVGFAEPSAFHRAFRQWTGVTPGAYRRRA